jgi:hypothetical protein
MQKQKPKLGRPPKPESEKLVMHGVPFHPNVLAELREVCEEAGLTQTAIVESALAREFRRLRRGAR